MDNRSKEARSINMSHIHSKNTKPEEKVCKYLFKEGFRYRKNVKTLPGTPDIVLPKYHAVIFVHGCFWHRHPRCKYAYTPKTRVEFWQEKFDKNVQNDSLHREELTAAGWRVFIIWECQLRGDRKELTLRSLADNLKDCSG